MANHTLTLSAEEEIALAAVVEEWTASQPETAWTPDIVLYTLVHSDLQTRLRALDRSCQEVLSLARQMNPGERMPLLRGLSGARGDRLRQLLAGA